MRIWRLKYIVLLGLLLWGYINIYNSQHADFREWVQEHYEEIDAVDAMEAEVTDAAEQRAAADEAYAKAPMAPRE